MVVEIGMTTQPSKLDFAKKGIAAENRKTRAFYARALRLLDLCLIVNFPFLDSRGILITLKRLFG